MVLTHSSYYRGPRISTPASLCKTVPPPSSCIRRRVQATALLLADGHGSEAHYRSDLGAEVAIAAAAEALPYILEILPGR